MENSNKKGISFFKRNIKNEEVYSVFWSVGGRDVCLGMILAEGFSDTYSEVEIAVLNVVELPKTPVITFKKELLRQITLALDEFHNPENYLDDLSYKNRFEKMLWHTILGYSNDYLNDPDNYLEDPNDPTDYFGISSKKKLGINGDKKYLRILKLFYSQSDDLYRYLAYQLINHYYYGKEFEEI